MLLASELRVGALWLQCASGERAAMFATGGWYADAALWHADVRGQWFMASHEFSMWQ